MADTDVNANENVQSNRQRLESDGDIGKSKLESAGNGYYPVVEQLVKASSDVVETRFKKMTKDYIICVTRELVSQLREARQQLYDKNEISGSLSEIKRDV